MFPDHVEILQINSLMLISGKVFDESHDSGYGARLETKNVIPNQYSQF